MSNSVRMLWPYPNKDSDPWYQKFDDMVTAQDQSGFASREDRNIILGGGGLFSWDSGTGTLAWDATLEFYSTIAGFRLDLAPAGVNLQDGEALYVDLTRFPRVNSNLTPLTAFTVPNTNDAYVLGIRRGDDVFMRTGDQLQHGDSKNIFTDAGAGANTDTYERSATFGVPEGSPTEEATVGRINFSGSMVGLAVEITEPVTGGTITVNAKRNGVTLMTGVLTTTATTSVTLTAPPGTHPISTNDQITVEYIAAGYTNTASIDGGLTVNVTLSAGIALPLGGVADASQSVKGVTKLSVDPVLANEPIAVGDNDPRLVENRRILHTIGAPDGTDYNVTISPAMPNSAYVVMHTLATVGSHVTLNVPTANRAAGSFRVLMSAPLTIGETIYFHVVAL